MKIKRFLIIFFILIIFVISVSFLIIQIKKYKATEHVMEYLTEEKGYDETEIATIESKYTFFGLPTYYVEVSFKNEPNIIYIYTVDNLIGQLEYYTTDGETLPIEHLKNYDPIDEKK